jgi:hypothetical protein
VKTWIHAGLGLSLLLCSALAGAQTPPPEKKSTVVRDVGIGLTIGGVAMDGLGTYFVLQGNRHDDAGSFTGAVLCYALGGVGLLAGVPMWIFGSPKGNDGATSTTVRPYLVVGPLRAGIGGTF